jgi:hypothetical protein
MKEAYSKTKKRCGPDYTPKGLSTEMGQGGGYHNGAPKHGLSRQMDQGEGYSHPIDPTAPLGKVMQQR